MRGIRLKDMKLIDALEALEMAPRGNERLKELTNVASKCESLKKILYLVKSKDVKFNIKQLPSPEFTVTRITSYEAHLFKLLNLLRTRTLTGNDAKAAIALHLGSCTDLERKWSERIIKRDLRLDLSTKSINKILPGTIATFDVPLAWSYKDAPSLSGLWCLEPKFDGARCVSILPCDGTEVKIYSRKGIEWKNFESIRTLLQTYSDTKPHNQPLVLDGEIIAVTDDGVDFQAVQSTLFATKRKTEIGDTQYIVFDSALKSEWDSPNLNYSDRLDLTKNELLKIQELVGCEKIKLVDCETSIKDPTEEQLTELCLKFVEAGNEGAMIRRLDKPVKMGRSYDLLKIKLWYDDEAEIVDKIEGKGDLQGSLGAFWCRMKNGVEFELGGGKGLTHALRLKYWKEPVEGKWVTFRYANLTNDGKPRFAGFKGIRHEDDMS